MCEYYIGIAREEKQIGMFAQCPGRAIRVSYTVAGNDQSCIALPSAKDVFAGLVPGRFIEWWHHRAEE